MKEKIEILWNDLRPINKETWPYHNEEKDPDEYRFDDCGAILKKSEYGKETDFGYTIDHMFPISKGGDDNIENLRLLHWKNNKLKGDDFPTFSYDTARTLENNAFRNESMLRARPTFAYDLLAKLRSLYPQVSCYC